jgi:hypothetical protein
MHALGSCSGFLLTEIVHFDTINSADSWLALEAGFHHVSCRYPVRADTQLMGHLNAQPRAADLGGRSVPIVVSKICTHPSPQTNYPQSAHHAFRVGGFHAGFSTSCQVDTFSLLRLRRLGVCSPFSFLSHWSFPLERSRRFPSTSSSVLVDVFECSRLRFGFSVHFQWRELSSSAVERLRNILLVLFFPRDVSHPRRSERGAHSLLTGADGFGFLWMVHLDSQELMVTIWVIVLAKWLRFLRVVAIMTQFSSLRNLVIFSHGKIYFQFCGKNQYPFQRREYCEASRISLLRQYDRSTFFCTELPLGSSLCDPRGRQFRILALSLSIVRASALALFLSLR